MDRPYRIGVLSDTHLDDFNSALALAERLSNGPFAKVDMILHAGDMVMADFSCCFGNTPFYAVRGNMDPPEFGVPIKRIVTVGGLHIGLIHGWGPPQSVPGNVYMEFMDERIDALVFGHSHTPYRGFIGETLLFNPGSATDHRGRACGCSVGLLEWGKTLEACHLYID